MAIYRGAGGAGDAVADSTSEALLVRTLAAQATIDAASAATSATSASASATSAAASAATIDTTAFARKSNNLSDLTSASTARTNLGLGTAATTASTAYATAAQGTTADTAYADRLKWDGGATGLVAATGRTSLGLGTIATQADNSVAITGGSITGITDLAVADGGTGASTAANARTNLGLVIGTDVQAYNANTAFLNTNQNFTVAQRGTITALTDGATITPNFNNANNFSVTLGGNRTLANPTNLTAGQSGVIVITQDGTGSRTLAYGSYFKFPGGTAPTLTTTASAVDVLAYYVESTTRITARLVADVK